MDSYFEKGITLEGTLWVKGNVHFGAHIEGEVYSDDHLIIGSSGYVKGDIRSYDFSNSGKVEGNIFSENKTALLRGGALTGNISTYQLVVDEGADFGGRCKMIDAPVDQNSREAKTEKRPNTNNRLTLGTKLESEVGPKPIMAAKYGQLMLLSKLPKIARIFLIGFVLIASFIFFKPKPGDPKNSIKAGYDLLGEGRYEEAEIAFRNALKKTRNSSELYAGLGETFLQRKLYDDAVSYFKRSSEMKPANASYKISLAKAYQSLGQLKDAEKYFQLAIDTNPQRANSFYHYGLFMEEKGEIQNAISSHRKALELDNSLDKARYSLGKLFEETGRLDDAITEYTFVLKHDANNAALHLALGKLLLNSNNSSKAVFHLNKAVGLMPQNFQVRVNVAEMM
ncbi:MAG: tetratricopeptide repeat protein, partial [Verrucomicrobiales bacterium]|nr:tetratricopeptide repeat protein [Verrucomicrobiales bacterium]